MSYRGDELRSGDDGPLIGDVMERERARARSVALRQLAAAPRTRFQLEQSLVAKEIEPPVIAEVLDRYVAVGLVDDQAFAEVFVRSRLAERGLAKRAIALELHRRGVAPEIVQEVLESIDPSEEVAAARRLVDKRLRSLRGVEPHIRYRRIAGALGRKGFAPSLIRRVLEEALSDQAAEEGSLTDDAWIDLED